MHTMTTTGSQKRRLPPKERVQTKRPKQEEGGPIRAQGPIRKQGGGAKTQNTLAKEVAKRAKEVTKRTKEAKKQAKEVAKQAREVAKQKKTLAKLEAGEKRKQEQERIKQASIEGRIDLMKQMERTVRASLPHGGSENPKHVIGVDEAGRGPYAGPVVVASAIVPDDVRIPGVRDSKQMTKTELVAIHDKIVNDNRIVVKVALEGAPGVDRLNILEATMQCMKRVVEQQVVPPGTKSEYHALVDGNRLPKGLEISADAVVKGDDRCYCIAVASIVAKVTRDRIMHGLHSMYPQYGFDTNVGYGTAAHEAAIHKHGMIEGIHRKTFCKKFTTNGPPSNKPPTRKMKAYD